jgi:Protein of unknown function (DUF4232)
VKSIRLRIRDSNWFFFRAVATLSIVILLPTTFFIESAVASTKPCLSTQLSVVRGHLGVAMGSIGSENGFKNISSVTCSLRGYPKLQMVDGAGRAIATHVMDGTSVTVSFVPVKTVILKPGAEAIFDLGYTDATGYGTASCPTSAQVEITPPNTSQPITVVWQLQAYGGSAIALRCGVITVSPVYAPPGINGGTTGNLVSQCAQLDVKEAASTNQHSYRPGISVKMTASIRNVSSSACSIIAGAISPSYLITNAKGVVVWNNCYASKGQPGACPLFLVLRRLNPGATYSATVTWNQMAGSKPTRVGGGIYELHATFTGLAKTIMVKFTLIA